MQQKLSTARERFPSVVDSWVLIVLAIVPLISVGVLVAAIASGEGVLAALIGPLIVAGIYGGLLYPVYYELEPDHLLIRFGVVHRRVAYTTIRSVRPTHNPLSSPALSLRRLRIDYGKGALSFVLISPQRRDEFLDALAARTGLNREGDALV
ncbi:MAG: PH domain-containing protein [Dehalococcoidia bacterium]